MLFFYKTNERNDIFKRKNVTLWREIVFKLMSYFYAYIFNLTQTCLIVSGDFGLILTQHVLSSRLFVHVRSFESVDLAYYVMLELLILPFE